MMSINNELFMVNQGFLANIYDLYEGLGLRQCFPMCDTEANNGLNCGVNSNRVIVK